MIVRENLTSYQVPLPDPLEEGSVVLPQFPAVELTWVEDNRRECANSALDLSLRKGTPCAGTNSHLAGVLDAEAISARGWNEFIARWYTYPD